MQSKNFNAMLDEGMINSILCQVLMVTRLLRCVRRCGIAPVNSMTCIVSWFFLRMKLLRSRPWLEIQFAYSKLCFALPFFQRLVLSEKDCALEEIAVG